jgi:RNA recognition motif-containing protein
MRNDNNKGQQFANKRTLKESYCQNNYQRSKIRPNFGNKNFNEIVNNRRNNTNNNNSKAKPPINLKQDIEQRKIIYVGKIPDGTTKTDIRHWFGRFGAIKEVSIHFRDYGDNYAFVTFYRRCDAYEAIERMFSPKMFAF